MINKDQWCNVLEFSRTISLDLSNYDEDGACESSLLGDPSFLPGKSFPSLPLSLSPPFPIEPGAPCMLGKCCTSTPPALTLLPLLSLQGQFCWMNLWNGIKTNRCPRTVCIAARESLLPRLRHPLAINCCLYRSACCFSCTVSLLQGCLVFAIEWASLLAV